MIYILVIAIIIGYHPDVQQHSSRIGGNINLDDSAHSAVNPITHFNGRLIGQDGWVRETVFCCIMSQTIIPLYNDVSFQSETMRCLAPILVFALKYVWVKDTRRLMDHDTRRPCQSFRSTIDGHKILTQFYDLTYSKQISEPFGGTTFTQPAVFEDGSHVPSMPEGGS